MEVSLLVHEVGGQREEDGPDAATPFRERLHFIVMSVTIVTLMVFMRLPRDDGPYPKPS
jgi:hypothetical protein